MCFSLQFVVSFSIYVSCKDSFPKHRLDGIISRIFMQHAKRITLGSFQDTSSLPNNWMYFPKELLYHWFSFIEPWFASIKCVLEWRCRELLLSEETSDAYEKCKAITMDFAKTFYFATLFQPEVIQPLNSLVLHIGMPPACLILHAMDAIHPILSTMNTVLIAAVVIIRFHCLKKSRPAHWFHSSTVVCCKQVHELKQIEHFRAAPCVVYILQLLYFSYCFLGVRIFRDWILQIYDVGTIISWTAAWGLPSLFRYVIQMRGATNRCSTLACSSMECASFITEINCLPVIFQDQRKSVYAIYAWCRTLDEIVDAVGAANDSTHESTLASLEDSLAMRRARLDLMWMPADASNLSSREVCRLSIRRARHLASAVNLRNAITSHTWTHKQYTSFDHYPIHHVRS